jgi:multidrug efflux pump subunit AcrB
MDKITKFTINNSRFAILAMFFIVLIGIQTFVNMPSQEDPEITIRNAQVSVYFPGMPTDQIEDLIAKPLEKKIKQIPEIEDITTTVKTGQVLVEPKVYDKYFDLDPIWQDLRNKMDDMKKDLPKGAIGPIVNDDYGRVSVATIAMTGKDFDMKEMRGIALDLQDKIATLNSVSKVDIMGIQKEQIYLDINANKIANYGLSLKDLVNALQAQNVVLPGGSVNADGNIIVIEPSGNFKSVEEIKNIQVQGKKGELAVYLRDVVEVRRAYVDPAEYEAFYNGKPAVIFAVSMVPRHNIEDFGVEITNKVNDLQNQLPLGLELDYATYQPTLVKQAVDDAVSNLYQTVAVVLVVVVLFLGLRTGLIVGSIVPLTILLSIIAMNMWSIDLQRMSIAAIIIALGLLVDNGIVIAEDMKSRIDSGTNKKDAAIKSAKNLGVPLLISSLTTILAFMPLMLAENVSSEYLRSLSQVIITTLLSSWFLAMFATPALCYWFLEDKNDAVKNNTDKEADVGDSKWYVLYESILKKTLKHRISIILSMFALLLVSGYCLKFIPKQMMPYSDRNQFLVYVDMPASTHVAETKAVTQRLTSWLSDKEANPDIISNVAYIGYGGPRFFLMVSPPNPGGNVAFVVVNTKSSKDVWPLLDKVEAFANESMPEARVRAKAMSLGASDIGIVEYRVVGPDVRMLYKISRDIEEKMLSIKGSTGISNDWNEPVIRTRVEVDQDRARRAGVTSKSIANVLNSYFEGAKISDYREGDKSIPIVVKGDEGRNNWSEVRLLPVMSSSGTPVPLIQVADFKGYIAPAKFKRFNQERTLKVSGKHKTMQANEFHNLLWPFVKNIDLPEGYRIEIGGEIEGSKEANEALGANLPIALIGIVILLILQFNSFRRSLIITLTIPLVIIGAVVGLFVGNAFFSFTAILGIYSLVGIIVNNGIVLIDRIDTERENITDVNDAIIKACIARMRPIIMTTLTTILGLIPLAMFGGAMWYPMAVVIMGGLFVGTILTLCFVPALYSLFFTGKITGLMKKLGV